MELEKEIKQKTFQSPYHKLALNILFTASWLNSTQNKLLKPHGISPQQYNILRILRGQQGNVVPLGLLQERMIDKMSNASRLVDKLVLKKLVNRKQCPNDRRQLEIGINEKGLELLKSLDAEVQSTQDMLKTITEKEAKEVNRILDKMRD
jgi:DNA-binding MarR family transcriptional regulator